MQGEKMEPSATGASVSVPPTAGPQVTLGADDHMRRFFDGCHGGAAREGRLSAGDCVGRAVPWTITQKAAEDTFLLCNVRKTNQMRITDQERDRSSKTGSPQRESSASGL